MAFRLPYTKTHTLGRPRRAWGMICSKLLLIPTNIIYWKHSASFGNIHSQSGSSWNIFLQCQRDFERQSLAGQSTLLLSLQQAPDHACTHVFSQLFFGFGLLFVFWVFLNIGHLEVSLPGQAGVPVSQPCTSRIAPNCTAAAHIPQVMLYGMLCPGRRRWRKEILKD